MGICVEDGKKTVGPMDLFLAALKARNAEISLSWRRSNHFLAANVAIALGFFELRSREFIYPFLLSGLGLWASYLWFNACLGAKFWQERWEHRLRMMESLLLRDSAMPEEMKLFSADGDAIHADVEASLKNSRHAGMRRLLDVLVLNRPSVSCAMIALPLGFTVGWFVTLVAFIVLRAG